jgi:hypothetical protein
MPTTHTLKVEDEKSSRSSQGRTERPSGAAAVLIAKLEWLSDEYRGTDAGCTDDNGDHVDVSEALRDAAAALKRHLAPSPADLLRRLTISDEAGASRLVVMAQSPSNYHHWTKAVGQFTAAEVRASLAKQEG